MDLSSQQLEVGETWTAMWDAQMDLRTASTKESSTESNQETWWHVQQQLARLLEINLASINSEPKLHLFISL